MLGLSTLALTMLPLAVVASPVPQGPGGGPGQGGGPGVPDSSFELYAYGSGFGGLPVIYYNGYAFLGNTSLTNDTESAQVIFTQGSDGTSMIANPVPEPGTATPAWSNLTFYIPSSTSGDHLAGFTDDAASVDGSTSGFVFYGSIAAWEDSDGSLETLWYALPYGSTGLWTLNWNWATDDTDDKVLVTVKSTKPSIPPPAPPTGPNPPGGTGTPPSKL